MAGRTDKESVSKPLTASLLPARLNGKDAFGQTALHLAVRFAEFREDEYLKIIERLLGEEEAWTNTETYYGATPVREAAKYESPLVYDLLMQYATESKIERAPRESSLARIHAFMSHVFRDMETVTTRLKADAYSEMYNAVHHKGPEPMDKAKALYWDIKDFIAEYVSEVTSAAARMDNEHVICEFYCGEWTKFRRAAICHGQCLYYVDRIWVKREVDEGKKIPEIKELHFAIWRENFVNKEQRIRRIVHDMGERQKVGKLINEDQLDTLLDSFRVIGLDVDELPSENAES